MKQGEEILDEAAILFTKTFYELLFKEKVTICKAFSLAKEMLSSTSDINLAREANKFMMIKDTDLVSTSAKHEFRHRSKHECTVLGPFPSGEVEILDAKPIYPYEVAKVDEFVGRQQEMNEIIKCIKSNRLTTILGLPGIGKTTISKNIGFFLAERMLFRDGIVYFSLRGKDQANMLIQQMYLFFSRLLAAQCHPNQESKTLDTPHSSE